MKIIDLSEKKKDYIFTKLEEMLSDLRDYDIRISLNLNDLRIIYDELFNLYLEKGIIYEFREDILTYFNEIICLALEEKEDDFSIEYVNKGFIFCQELMSPIEITKKDVNKTLAKANKKIKNRRSINGKWKHHKKLWLNEW